MLLHSRIPPKHLWREIERELRREGCGTQEALPLQLFCGKQAVSLTQEGPRWEECLRTS